MSKVADACITDGRVSVPDAGEHLEESKGKLDNGTVLQQNPREPSCRAEGGNFIWRALREHDAFQDPMEEPHTRFIGSFPISLAAGAMAGLRVNPRGQIVVTDGAFHGLKAQMDQKIRGVDFAGCALAETCFERQFTNPVSVQPGTCKQVESVGLIGLSHQVLPPQNAPLDTGAVI